MSKARGLADLGNVYDDGALSNRNLIINGAMQVAQRGTSFTSVSSTAYHLDRFYLFLQNTSSVYTVTQDGDAPAGFGASLRLDVTTEDGSTASNEEVKFYQKIEGQNLQSIKKGTSEAEQITLSFYVKTNKTGTYVVELYDRDSGRDVSASYTVLDTNWNRYELTFPADTTGAFDNDNASSLEIQWWLVAGSAVQGGTLNTNWRSAADASSATGQVNFADNAVNEWQITGVQLEVGDTATPFEHRSYSDEIQRCMRYYETVYVWQQGHASASGEYVAASTGTYKTTKRATPTLTEQVVSGGSSSGVSFGTFRNFELGGFGVQGISTRSGEVYRDTLVTADAEL
jgi:hypothetical protein